MGITTSDNPLANDLDHILDHTRELWYELRGQRLFITGGTGFFGCWLLESFIWANEKLNLHAQATLLTRSPDAFRVKAPHLAGNETVALLQGDVRAFDFPSGTFSHIIHASSECNPANAPLPSNLLFQANVQGTTKVLELSQQCSAKKFLFTSSGAVYGKQPPEITHLPEDYTGAPLTTDSASAYGQGKRASEFLCATTATSGFEVKIARCFAFVGPYLPLDTNFAIGNFIRDALHRDSPQITGDGTPHRSYLYAADLAIWLWTILFQGKSCRPYNVGSEKDLSIGELAKIVAEIITPGLPIEIAQEHIYNKPIERYVPMVQRAKNELGLQEFITLSDAIQRTARWYTRK